MAIDANQLLVAVKAFSRANPLPIDATSVYDSLADAQAYAKAANAYAGQVITVKGDDGYSAYILDGEAGSYTLTKVGLDASAVKNYVQVVTELPKTGQEQGVVYINTTDKKGSIWNGTAYVTVFEQVDNLQTAIDTINGSLEQKADKGDSLAAYGITDAYTKDETNAAIANAVASAGHLKRSIVDKLPVSDIDDDTIYMIAKADDGKKIYHANVDVLTNGNYAPSVLTDLPEGTSIAAGDYVVDVQNNCYQVSKVEGGKFYVGSVIALEVNHYDEYLFINGTFEKIGDTAVDLTGYAKTADVTSAINDAKTAAAADAKSKADKALTDAKAYSDGLAANYDAAGSANQALIDAKAYADTQDETTLASAKSYTDTALKPISDNLNTKVDQAAVDSSISAKIGDIAEGTTVKSYIDTAVGSGGTASAEAIATAKEEAISAAQTYTDTALTITEF